MYRTNSGRKFNDYKVYINDIRYVTIREEDNEMFEQELNGMVQQLNDDGYVVIGISYKMEDIYFSAVIEYISADDIYYYVEEEGGEKDGRE